MRGLGHLHPNSLQSLAEGRWARGRVQALLARWVTRKGARVPEETPRRRKAGEDSWNQPDEAVEKGTWAGRCPTTPRLRGAPASFLRSEAGAYQLGPRGEAKAHRHEGYWGG